MEQAYKAKTERNGIVAAVLDQSDSQIMTFGQASKDQYFEVGSITKTLTANLLAQSVLEGVLKLSDPIPDAYQKPGSTITYQHLTTHMSGIVGNFADYNSGDPLFPFKGLTTSVFKEHYAKTPLVSVPGKTWSYSNVAVSLLGLILSERAGTSYEDLIRKQVLAPLGMTESFFHMPDSELARFPTGHLIINKNPAMAAPYWDLSTTALGPAGGLRSTIGDMIKFARANLAPESTPLAKALSLAQQPLQIVSDELSMGMNWMIYPKTDVMWHHGATGGYNSVLAISKSRGVAVVALTDTASYIIDSTGVPQIDPAFQDAAIDCLK